MSLSNKQMSSILYTIADATSRMIDALDNDGKLNTADARAIRNTMLKNICDVELDDFIQQRRANHKLLMKRGSSTDNNEYIGKNGEITVDTDEKTLRVHDGQTAGGTTLARVSDIPEITSADYVIAWQNPTAENNYTWYRQYKSGWVEQGGFLNTGSYSSTQAKETTINLIVPMHTGYSVLAMATSESDNNASRINFSSKSPTNTAFVLSGRNLTNSSSNNIGTYWYVCGIGAQ